MFKLARTAVASRRPHRRQSAFGFSLVELGIVMAVIAVMGFAVIASRGYFIAARKKAAVDLVLTIRTASRHFAMRHQRGLNFGDPARSDPVNVVSLKQLIADNFLSKSLRTPWGGEDIEVAPETTGAPCLGYTCVRIVLGDVPDDECADIREAFRDTAVEAKCNGTKLTVVMR